MEKLLKRLKINFQEIMLTVSLEQQFFILPKDFIDKRLDLKYAKRLLVGTKPFQISADKTYMHKIPSQVQTALKQAEAQLLELGVPFKVRHCEGGANQFKIQTQIQNASTSIDYNILIIKILQESCQRHGLEAIFHEKPFRNVNSSGKHINWSISYLDQKDKIKNLYDLKGEHTELLTLLILSTLKAIQDNHRLFIGSAMTPGNEVRLGQKEAPFAAMSVYLKRRCLI